MKYLALSYEVVDPHAEALSESLRAFGYNLPTAIADVVDNSITAKAKHVEIDLFWAGRDSWLRITDDGSSMTEAQLVEAMRAGTKGPLEQRDPHDLGRFGLGLKTASFSQCRRLTVTAKAKGRREATRCWDLDFIQKQQKWALIQGPADEGAASLLSHRSADWPSRTVVLWQKMDRVVGIEPKDDQAAQRHFLERIEGVERHLGMVFHRFLTGPRALSIKVNENDVDPWDPFLADHASTISEPVAHYGTGDHRVTVQPFVLPHESKLEKDEHAAAAGVNGWNAHQGFYIYRNRRLLAAGEWLGFFKKDEHHKLARILVDLPNSLDAEWKIDVRKAHAFPPDGVRQFLRPIAEATRTRAEGVYRHRGKRILENQREPRVYMWEQLVRHNKVHYRLNRNHPLIKRIIAEAGPRKKDVNALLRLIEETIPINHIIGNFGEHAKQQKAAFHDTTGEVAKVAILVGKALKAQGFHFPEIRRRLLAIDPFQHYPDIVAAINAETLED